MQIKDPRSIAARTASAVLAACVMMGSAYAEPGISDSAHIAPQAPASSGPPPAPGQSSEQPVSVAEPALPNVVVPEPAVGAVRPQPEAQGEPKTPSRGADGGLAEPKDIGKAPVLSHIAGTGAKLVEIGVSHGLRGILARRGEEFMLLQMTPDGEAVVSGLQADFPVSQLMAFVGSQVTELGTAHGLRGLFARDGGEFQVFYVTPDGARVIPGVMWDASGKNITREQVARVPGAVPSVVIGNDPGAGAAAAGGTQPALGLVGKTSFGLIGPDSAPRLWMFADPLCSFSVRALQEVRPFAEKGQVQVAVIPVSVLDYETQGQSTPAALSLLSKPASGLVEAWARGDLRGPAAPEAQDRLKKNMEVAGAIGLKGTPTVIWRKDDGSEGRADGVPDWKAVIASLGVAHAGE